jgi:hypothetical protein
MKINLFLNLFKYIRIKLKQKIKIISIIKRIKKFNNK